MMDETTNTPGTPVDPAVTPATDAPAEETETPAEAPAEETTSEETPEEGATPAEETETPAA